MEFKDLTVPNYVEAWYYAANLSPEEMLIIQLKKIRLPTDNINYVLTLDLSTLKYEDADRTYLDMRRAEHWADIWRKTRNSNDHK